MRYTRGFEAVGREDRSRCRLDQLLDLPLNVEIFGPDEADCDVNDLLGGDQLLLDAGDIAHPDKEMRRLLRH